MVKATDNVVDVGPEGGTLGGQIVAESTPEKVAKTAGSYTGKFLKEELKG